MKHRLLLSIAVVAMFMLGIGKFPARAQGAPPLADIGLGEDGPAIGFSPLFSDVGAIPGQPVVLLVRVENLSKDDVQFVPTVTPPPGWQPMEGPSFVLGPREHRVDATVLLPPIGTAPGPYHVDLTYTVTSPSSDGETTVRRHPIPANIQIEAKPELQLSVVEAPKVALTSPYTVRFLLRNVGNIDHTLRLHASDNVGFPMKVSPDRTELAPGEERIVTVETLWGQSQSESIVHRPTLHGVDAFDAEERVRGTARVELVPPSPPRDSSSPSLPLRGVFRLGARRNELRTSAEIYGHGSYADGVPRELAVHVADDHHFVSYADGGRRIALGNQHFELSPLTTNKGPARGIQLHTDEPFNVGIMSYSTDDGITGIGFRSSLFRARSSETAFHVFASSAGDKTIGTIQTGFSPANSMNIAGEYGRQLSPPGTQAFSLSTTIAGVPQKDTAGTFSSTATWRRFEAGYADNKKATEQFSAASELRAANSRWTWYQWTNANYEAGFGSALASRRRQMTLTWSNPDPEGWQSVRYYSDNLLSDDETETTSRRLSALWRHDFPDGSGLRISIGGMHVYGKTAVPRWRIPVRGDFYFPLQTGRLRFYVNGDVATSSSSVPGLRAGVGLSRRDDTWAARIWVDATMGGKEPYRLGGDVQFTLANDHRLEGDIRLRWGADAGGAKGQWRIGYVVPFDVVLPLAGRRNTGEVSGSIVDEKGKGLANVVLRIGDRAVRTDAEGVYRFSEVASGEHVITVDRDTFPADRFPLPGLYQSAHVYAGETTDVSFRIVPGAHIRATVTGPLFHRLSVHDGIGPTEIASPVFPRPREGLDALRSVVPEARQHDLLLRRGTRTTDPFIDEAMGTVETNFHFDNVSPGEWIVMIPPHAVPAGYVADGLAQRIVLEPGEIGHVHFRLRPQTRRLQFIDLGDDGVLGLPPERSGD